MSFNPRSSFCCQVRSYISISMFGSGSGAYKFCTYELAKGSSKISVKGRSAFLTWSHALTQLLRTRQPSPYLLKALQECLKGIKFLRADIARISCKDLFGEFFVDLLEDPFQR